MGTAASLFDVFLPRPRETTRLPGSFSAAALVVYHFVASGEFGAQRTRGSTAFQLRQTPPEVLCNSHPGRLGPHHQLEETIRNELANCTLRWYFNALALRYFLYKCCSQLGSPTDSQESQVVWGHLFWHYFCCDVVLLYIILNTTIWTIY